MRAYEEEERASGASAQLEFQTRLRCVRSRRSRIVRRVALARGPPISCGWKTKGNLPLWK